MKKNEHLIFGIHPVLEALKAGKDIEKLYIQKDLSDPSLSELRKLIKENNVSSTHVPVQRLNRFTSGNHQGIVAIITPIKLHYDVEDLVLKVQENNKEPLLLLLDKVTDVRNFGAICRTAECAGVDAIIIPGNGSAQINADAIKTSAGALNRIPIYKVENLTDTVYLLKELNIKIVGCTEKTDATIYETDYRKAAAIIMGSEDKGISNQLLKLCDSKAKIPMVGNISSLNVSVASGIILYEALKQRTI